MYKKSQTNIADIEVFPGNVFYVVITKGAEIDLESTKQLLDATDKMLDPNIPTRGGVYDLTGITYMTDEAREYCINHENIKGVVVSAGLVSNSFLGKLVGNFFLTINKPTSWPMKFFSSPISAEHWVRGQMKEYLNNPPSRTSKKVA